jgi:hypothetical protein
MSRFDAALRNMDDRVFDTFGDPCIHTPKDGDPVRRRVVLDRDVQRSGFDVQRVGPADELQFLNCEGPRPGSGDLVEILETGERFRLDAEVRNDGAVCVMAAREVSGG